VFYLGLEGHHTDKVYIPGSLLAGPLELTTVTDRENGWYCGRGWKSAGESLKQLTSFTTRNRSWQTNRNGWFTSGYWNDV